MIKINIVIIQPLEPLLCLLFMHAKLQHCCFHSSTGGVYLSWTRGWKVVPHSIHLIAFELLILNHYFHLWKSWV